mmetsp:Transcript_97013/g.283542  ORF Transcript_97013/g.283542 Transcript_97013/m.283542 type:complete len:277 (+) Transcript_97013:82-912(+)
MARKALLCALLLRCCGCTAAAHVPDDSALVQGGVHVHQQQAASAASSVSRVELVRRATAGQWPQLPAFQFNCTAAPGFCQAPFNCHQWKPESLARLPFEGAAPGGHPNFGMWCPSPAYHDYMDACINQKDLVKAAKLQFSWSVNQRNSVDELDGSYCFIEGHCSNEAVTNATTLEESNQMCDQRYGRKGWSEFGRWDTIQESSEAMQGMPKDPKNGFKNTKTTTFFLKMACLMGNYHCDVMYCKETYCKDPYYINRYAHLLPKAPGHLLQSRGQLD